MLRLKCAISSEGGSTNFELGIRIEYRITRVTDMRGDLKGQRSKVNSTK